MKYVSNSAELLKATDVKNGDKLRIVGDAYTSQSNGKVYWNCKVKLADGSIKLAGIIDQSGDAFAKAWGAETSEWTGHAVTVEIKTSQKGNQYIQLIPSDEPKVEMPKTTGGVEYPGEQIDPNDIPF